MKIVCHNSNSAIYDDGDFWNWIDSEGKEQKWPKKEYPLLPLTSVINYDMETDNKKLMNELRKKA